MDQWFAAFNPDGTLGFYDSVDSVPSDLTPVEITNEERIALLGAESQGKRLAKGDDGKPVAIDPPPPTTEQIVAANTAVRDLLLLQASQRVAPLQDAVDLDEATDVETALLKQWKQYRVAVNRIDLTQADPVWPVAPQGS
ncbi:hypothetical protein BURK_001740 [Burkholderia sp. SJ98]|uniref:tail fiber assembly protein n=1 Tax=Caballeronia zhejiangensis TaxID=871203 RepID=UPI00025B9CA2|nr:tail assembly chaperone [Caballeronia zhejiangensis]EKS73149.1 hypothetical protein BURK_001740 [Burkholderia sp. SJ98]